MKNKLLWFSWKDMTNPDAGGAEVVTNNILTRLAQDGWEVILLTAGHKNSTKSEEIKNGYKIIRVGGRWSVYWHAYKYYKKNLNGWPNIIIEEINTIPFFTQFYTKRKNRFLFFHQLCRQIWFYQMFFPLNIIGYLIEPIYLWLIRDNDVITISNSTKVDLTRYGFSDSKINIISEGIDLKPIDDLTSIKKYNQPTMLSLGAIREMKRTIEQVKAFEIAKEKVPDLKMVIAGGGNGKYFDKFKSLIQNSKYSKDIEYLGRVSQEKKIEVMQKAHFITVTSVKEGWGLIVTESNSQGTPAIVYNVDGLRDSVKNNETGLICERNTPSSLANSIEKLIKDKNNLEKLREKAWQWSKEITFERCANQFKEIVEIKN